MFIQAINSLFQRCINFLIPIVFSFFFSRSFKISLLSRRKLHLIISRLQPYSFHPSLLCDHSFNRSSSWRFYMMVHQGFIFLLKVFIEVLFLRSSSILHLAFRSAISFYRIFGGGFTSFLIIWVHDSHVIKNEVF